jgi:hypothetical protein
LALEADMDEMETLTMSSKELNRLEVLRRVLERRLTQVQAAEQLGLHIQPAVFKKNLWRF